MNRLATWIRSNTLQDPIEQEQAIACQMTGIILSIGAVVWLPISLSAFSNPTAQLLALSSSLSVWFFSALATIALRRGAFKTAVVLTTIGIFSAVTLVLSATGLSLSGGLIFVYALPLVLVGLTWGRRGLILFGGLCYVVLITLTTIEYQLPGTLGFGSLDEPITVLGTAGLGLILLCLFIDQFGIVLQRSLKAALGREQELIAIRKSLETTVSERTTELSTALHTVEQREARLTQTLEKLRSSQDIIREMSTPIIPVMEGVLVTPLVGVVGTDRAEILTRNTLKAVEQQKPRYVIFDITGVPVVDTQVAQTLLQITKAIRLLGAQAILVGIRPEVAQTLVGLHVSLDSMITYADLQEAIVTLLRREGWQTGNRI